MHNNSNNTISSGNGGSSSRTNIINKKKLDLHVHTRKTNKIDSQENLCAEPIDEPMNFNCNLQTSPPSLCVWTNPPKRSYRSRIIGIITHDAVCALRIVLICCFFLRGSITWLNETRSPLSYYACAHTAHFCICVYITHHTHTHLILMCYMIGNKSAINFVQTYIKSTVTN